MNYLIQNVSNQEIVSQSKLLGQQKLSPRGFAFSWLIQDPSYFTVKTMQLPGRQVLLNLVALPKSI